ncbi:MAG: hypothetical protein H7837_06550 [Magnetococcus sp. MYC-9]
METLTESLSCPPSPAERLARWLAMAHPMPPEQLAAMVESPQAAWMVVTESGGPHDKVRYTACLDNREDLPCWAFALAKSYLDDVGEWPLSGMATELAFHAWEDHQDPIRGVREILASIQPVWPDMEVVYAGEKRH